MVQNNNIRRKLLVKRNQITSRKNIPFSRRTRSRRTKKTSKFGTGFNRRSIEFRLKLAKLRRAR